jgi:D-aminopeptidase
VKIFISSDMEGTAGVVDWDQCVAGVERTGDLSAVITGDDPLWIYQTFITVVLLCRGLVE